MSKLRGEDSNLDLHVQSVTSYPLDDPEKSLSSAMSRRPEPNDVFHASRLPFDPGSTVLCGRTSSYVEEFWSPVPAHPLKMRMLKLTLIRPLHFQRAAAENLSLSGGASIRFRAVSS